MSGKNEEQLFVLVLIFHFCSVLSYYSDQFQPVYTLH
jgi:hypothetical protein